MDDTDLLIVQDDKKTCIELGILYYCKRMPICPFTNLNRKLGIVNRAQTSVFRVIPNLPGNAQLFQL